MDNATTQRWQADGFPDGAPDADLMGSTLADRYLVTGVLGRGATADVYRAHDGQLDRDVAIKVLSRQMCVDREAVARFHDEGLLTAKVHHPNVASVFDTGTLIDRPFIVMECLSGGTLADRMSQGPLEAEEVRAMASQLLGALEAAHAVGVVHRDVKPSNVLLSGTGVAKLADFGIAKDDTQDDRTAVGHVVGTPSYMPPERLRGNPATAQSDLYALGMVLRNALLGRQPSGGQDASLDGDPAAGSSATLLSSVIERATRPDPELRYASAAEMRDALERPGVPTGAPRLRTKAERHRRSTRTRMIAALVVVLLLVATVSAIAIGRATSDGTPPDTGAGTTADPLPAALRTAIDDLRETVDP